MKQSYSVEKLKHEYLRPQVVIRAFNDVDVITSSGDGDWVADWWDIPATTNIFSP